MPLYEYECESCAKRFERIQKFSDPPVDVCPSCGSPVRKLPSSPAIQFKGSGWYITDYAKKSSDSGGGGAAKDTKDAAEGGKKDTGASGSDTGGTAAPKPAASTTKTE